MKALEKPKDLKGEQDRPKKVSTEKEKPKEEKVTKKYKKGRWTPEEDKALLLGVKMARDKGMKPNFRMITGALLNRSSKQAKERWENSLNPDIRKGRWSRKEELLLIELMIEYGQNWAAIQAKMPMRALHCVKAKGRLLLGERLSLIGNKSVDGNVANNEWSPKEIHELVTLHGLYGYDLKRISLLLGTGRSTAQIDRQLLSSCTCDQCRARSREIKVTTDVDSLKSSWTKVRAKAIKDNLLKEATSVENLELAKNGMLAPSGKPASLKRKHSDISSNASYTPERPVTTKTIQTFPMQQGISQHGLQPLYYMPQTRHIMVHQNMMGNFHRPPISPQEQQFYYQTVPTGQMDAMHHGTKVLPSQGTNILYTSAPGFVTYV